eukprot:jgi/Mesvir1/6539/Mv16800-RA.1
MLMSMFAPQNRLCAELRDDVGQLLSCQPDPLSVDYKHLARELSESKGYRVRVCETEGACFCLGAHKHVFLEVCASLSTQAPFEDVILVELALRLHFEVARPSKEYRILLDSLPRVFVGSLARLMQLVRFVVAAMSQSLRQEGMWVPPWRSPQAVMANWAASRCICGRQKSGVQIQRNVDMKVKGGPPHHEPPRQSCPVHPAGVTSSQGNALKGGSSAGEMCRDPDQNPSLRQQ